MAIDLEQEEQKCLRTYLTMADSVAIVSDDFFSGSLADSEARSLLYAGYRIFAVQIACGRGAWALSCHGSLAMLEEEGVHPGIVCLLCSDGKVSSGAAQVLALRHKPAMVWMRGTRAAQIAAAQLSECGMHAVLGESLAACRANLLNGDSPAFSCRRCGKCCEGRGGIVVSPFDLVRLSVFLGMPEGDVLARCTEQMRGQPVVRCGSDGFCMFFDKQKGCSIHPARPAVCRAWPFFRGNLVDRVSFAMARQDCPGICRACTHAAFAREGYRYLRDYKLLARDVRTEGRMLIVEEQDLPLTES